jgi:hypothetical protein
MWHSVYSPVKGMTSGGHLIPYDTLHLTEQICAYDNSKAPGETTKREYYTTNETHTINRQIICMMLAMPDLVGV